ncbi:unnamed protein product [Prorocentrum cordatum]|uniref:Uncharacterized protein n=1 Tax=Prorocentrum cordatum TaxID=2364126 RepID=A0ABN9V0I8_9DINO|nr:unnamed protein product [Polarella glacialis]
MAGSGEAQAAAGAAQATPVLGEDLDETQKCKAAALEAAKTELLDLASTGSMRELGLAEVPNDEMTVAISRGRCAASKTKRALVNAVYARAVKFQQGLDQAGPSGLALKYMTASRLCSIRGWKMAPPRTQDLTVNPDGVVNFSWDDAMEQARLLRAERPHCFQANFNAARSAISQHNSPRVALRLGQELSAWALVLELAHCRRPVPGGEGSQEGGFAGSVAVEGAFQATIMDFGWRCPSISRLVEPSRGEWALQDMLDKMRGIRFCVLGIFAAAVGRFATGDPPITELLCGITGVFLLKDDENLTACYSCLMSTPLENCAGPAGGGFGCLQSFLFISGFNSILMLLNLSSRWQQGTSHGGPFALLSLIFQGFGAVYAWRLSTLVTAAQAEQGGAQEMLRRPLRRAGRARHRPGGFCPAVFSCTPVVLRVQPASVVRIRGHA